MEEKNHKHKRIGLYVHIPFCVKKCKYCDFLSSAYNNDNLQHRNIALSYVKALVTEIKMYGYLVRKYRVSSIYIGGGTPSVIDVELIDKILMSIRENYSVDDDAEITLEVNPGTLLNKRVAEYKDIGINRISMGMQSANNDELKLLGRIHTYEVFEENYKRLREVGFRNISIDVISAIPNQTLESYRETLKKVVALKPEHISSYSLILEEGTEFYQKRNMLNLVSEDEEREMYYLTKSFLQEHGYKRYEISNYALPGKESRHNSSYWTGQEYLGFGIGASSYINDVRYDKISDMDRYISAYHISSIERYNINDYNKEFHCNVEHITKDRKMEEFMFLGLRLTKGISIEAFKNKFDEDIYAVYGKVLEKYVKSGHIEIDEDRIYLTDEGTDVSNVIFADFLLEE